MNNTASPFIRRLGVPGRSLNSCISLMNCPDLFELADGNFAIIGKDITDQAHNLPADAGCGPNERIVSIPRALLIKARNDIPTS